MLVSGRVAPSLVKYAQLRYASYQPLLMKSLSCKNSSTFSTIGREQKKLDNISGETTLRSPLRPSDISTLRWYSSQPSLPSKSEVERAFFKITVVIWDLVAKILAWSWSMFQQRVLGHPMVKAKWRYFNQKLEEARRS